MKTLTAIIITLAVTSCGLFPLKDRDIKALQGVGEVIQDAGYLDAPEGGGE